MSMNALLLTDRGLSLVKDYPTPCPQVGEALIRVRLAGICATDLALMAGYKGGFRGVLGHEFVGDVIDAPSAPGWVGKRVVGEINLGCNQCDQCQHGLGKHCRNRRTLGIYDKDGAMAEMLTLPLANLHEVPEGIADEAAVFTEPLAAAIQILEQLHLLPSAPVYLLGCGKLGMLIAQVLALSGCDLTVIGRQPQSLALLQEWHGCKVMLSRPENEGLWQDSMGEVVVEATGTPQGFALARKLVRPGGTLVLKSTYSGESPPIDMSQLVVDEICVVGSRCGPFPPALRLLESGRVRVLPLIQGCYPLQDATAAFAEARRRGVLKILLRPDLVNGA